MRIPLDCLGLGRVHGSSATIASRNEADPASAGARFAADCSVGPAVCTVKPEAEVVDQSVISAGEARGHPYSLVCVFTYPACVHRAARSVWPSAKRVWRASPRGPTGLPGEWLRLDHDNWSQTIVCGRCGSRWVTHLGAFSEHAVSRLHEHGEAHLRSQLQMQMHLP